VWGVAQGIVTDPPITSNALPVSTSIQHFVNTTVPADCQASVDLTPSATTGRGGGPFVRGSVGSGIQDTYYWVRWNLGASQLQLFKVVLTTATSLGTSALVPSIGVGHNVKIKTVGTTVSVELDGAAVISVTDSAVTGTGFAGLRGADGGFTLDNFLVTA
jgi:hypothetical protein